VAEVVVRAFADLSIRTKLIVIVAGTLLLAQSLSALLIREVVSKHILHQALTTVDILATSIQHDVTYDAQRDPQSDGQQIIAKYMTYYRMISSMAIYDHDMICSASSNPGDVKRRTRNHEVIDAVRRARPSLHVVRPDLRDLGIRSVTPILQGSHVVGALAIDVSMQDVQQTLDALDRRIGVIMMLKLAVVCLALFVLLRGTILARLNRLSGVTHAVAAGNYNARVGDERRDEIGQLGRAFDQMTTDLQTSQLEIANHNKHLEERVQEATAQLQQAYEELQNAQSQLVMNEKMATLGVLVAGVAHEINTPTGAVLNVSRNLDRQIATLPEQLACFKRDDSLEIETMVECLRALVARARVPQASASYQAQKAVDALLRDRGVPEFRARAAALCKLNFTDPEEIARYIECFKSGSFFAFAETCGSIAQAAHISEASAQKITEIIRALKYYAYSDTERLELVQVNDSIATALVLLDNHLKHKVHVRTSYDTDLPRIECTSELHQVWTNLITNANDAITERGAGPGEIEVATRSENGCVVVSITDNGAGIPENVRHRIFDPFFTTKDVGKGTGLGLCIVAGIVKKHHGTIKVDSEPGRTTFEVSLPILGPTVAESSTAAAEAPSIVTGRAKEAA